MITRHHYTYRITNIKENKSYYGVRTTPKNKKVIPIDDIGFIYFSSSKDKEFIQDQKDNPSNYKYKVIKIFDTRDAAMLHEAMLHKKFNVGVNKNFYNKSSQTSKGFDTTGTVGWNKGKYDYSSKFRRRIFEKAKYKFQMKWINQTIPTNCKRYYKMTPEVRAANSIEKKLFAANNPNHAKEHHVNLSKEEYMLIAEKRKVIFVKNGKETTSYIEGGKKGAHTKKINGKQIINFEENYISRSEKTSILLSRQFNSIIIYEGKKMTKSQMKSQKASNTMKSTFIDNKSIEEIRIKKMSDTKRKQSKYYNVYNSFGIIEYKNIPRVELRKLSTIIEKSNINNRVGSTLMSYSRLKTKKYLGWYVERIN